MASKQELEAQIEALVAEVETLKAGVSPDVAELTSLKAEVAELKGKLADNDKAGDQLAEALKAERLKNRDLNSALDVSTAQVRELQAKKPVVVPDRIGGREVLFEGTVKAAVEHFRRQFCHENDDCMILKGK